MREAWWFGFRDLFLCSRRTRLEMAQLSVKTDSFGRHKHCWKCPPWTSLWFAGTLTADIIYLASYLVNLSQFYLDMSLKLIFKSSVLPNHQKHAESFFKRNIYRFYWELFPSKGTKELLARKLCFSKVQKFVHLHFMSVKANSSAANVICKAR